MRIRRRDKPEADLDITSFMNLMIILVPVLLMTMVFSHTRILGLTLPDLSKETAVPADAEDHTLELVIEEEQLVINYPAGSELKVLPKENGTHNFEMLASVLRDVKRGLQQKGVKKRDILILAQPDTDYQTLVTTMDTARSFKAVVAASAVNAELFPDISLGDAVAQAAPQGQTSGGER